MATKITYILSKPTATTGADDYSPYGLSPAAMDQNLANLQAAVDSKAPLASPSFTGDVSSLGAFTAASDGSGSFVAQGIQHIFRRGSAGSLAEVGRFDTSGNLLVGVTSGSQHMIARTSVAESIIMGIGGWVPTYFYEGTAAGASAAAACIVAGRSVTDRSINTGGTINASGADYAEYIRKCLLCALVLKGQVVGFNSDGEITDKWADAISYGVKSTNPNLVGGDTWGNAEAVGERPTQPDEKATQEVKDQYAPDLAAFESRLETERQKFDRIAFSGLAPCNVLGAKVGDFIIAVQDGEGIAGLAVTSPTFEQYLKAVGRVRRILEDGRPEIAVIVH